MSQRNPFLVVSEVLGDDEDDLSPVLRCGHVGDGGLQDLRVGHGALGRVQGGQHGGGRRVVPEQGRHGCNDYDQYANGNIIQGNLEKGQVSLA